MTNGQVWEMLHILLVNLCTEDKITEDQHSAWECVIEKGPA